jgi:hypothetical protein
MRQCKALDALLQGVFPGCWVFSLWPVPPFLPFGRRVPRPRVARRLAPPVPANPSKGVVAVRPDVGILSRETLCSFPAVPGFRKKPVVPSGIKWIAFVFPTGWAMDGILKAMTLGQTVSSLAPNALMLFLYGIVSIVVASRVFRFS